MMAFWVFLHLPHSLQSIIDSLSVAPQIYNLFPWFRSGVTCLELKPTVKSSIRSKEQNRCIDAFVNSNPLNEKVWNNKLPLI